MSNHLNNYIALPKTLKLSLICFMVSAVIAIIVSIVTFSSPFIVIPWDIANILLAIIGGLCIYAILKRHSLAKIPLYIVAIFIPIITLSLFGAGRNTGIVFDILLAWFVISTIVFICCILSKHSYFWFRSERIIEYQEELKKTPFESIAVILSEKPLSIEILQILILLFSIFCFISFCYAIYHSVTVYLTNQTVFIFPVVLILFNLTWNSFLYVGIKRAKFSTFLFFNQILIYLSLIGWVSVIHNMVTKSNIDYRLLVTMIVYTILFFLYVTKKSRVWFERLHNHYRKKNLPAPISNG